MAQARQTQLAERPVVEVADEVIFKDEAAVHRHFDLKVQETGILLQQDIQAALTSHQSKVAMRGALMLGGVAFTVWFLWTIAVPVFVALLTAGSLLAAGLWAKFRLPVLMAKMRYKAEYQLREMRNNQRLALRQQELDYITKLQKQAEANPIQTRLLKAAEDEKRIKAARAQASRVKGRADSMRQEVDKVLKDDKSANVEAQEAIIRTLNAGHKRLNELAYAAEEALKRDKQEIRLMEISQSAVQDVTQMAAFLSKTQEGAALAESLTNHANTAAQTEVQAAMAALNDAMLTIN